MAQVAQVYNQASVIHFRHKEFKKAVRDITNAIALKAASGGVDADLALYLTNAGYAYWARENTSLWHQYSPFAIFTEFVDDTAERYLRQALVIYEQQFGVSEDVGDTLWFLAHICKHCDGDAYREQAMAIYRLILPPDDLHWGSIYLKAAQYPDNKGHPAKAFELYAHALEAYEMRYGFYERELGRVIS